MEQRMIQELLEGGIDIESIYQRLPGKDELIQRLLMKFPGETSYAMLLEAMEKNDYQKAFECAHNLKGVAANMDMHPLLESLSILVEKLRSENKEDMSSDFEKVKENYLQVINTIDKVFVIR